MRLRDRWAALRRGRMRWWGCIGREGVRTPDGRFIREGAVGVEPPRPLLAIGLTDEGGRASTAPLGTVDSVCHWPEDWYDGWYPDGVWLMAEGWIRVPRRRAFALRTPTFSCGMDLDVTGLRPPDFEGDVTVFEDARLLAVTVYGDDVEPSFPDARIELGTPRRNR